MGVARAKSSLYLGKPFLLKKIGTIQNPGLFEVAINETITENKTYRAYQVYFSCGFECFWRITKNSVVVASGRTGPGNSNSYFYFIPYLQLKKDDVIMLEYCSRSGIPSNAVPFETYIQSGEL